MSELGIVKRIGRRHPGAVMLLAEILRQIRPGHQMKAVDLHSNPSRRLERLESLGLPTRLLELRCDVHRQTQIEYILSFDLTLHLSRFPHTVDDLAHVVGLEAAARVVPA